MAKQRPSSGKLVELELEVALPTHLIVHTTASVVFADGQPPRPDDTRTVDVPLVLEDPQGRTELSVSVPITAFDGRRRKLRVTGPPVILANKAGA